VERPSYDRAFKRLTDAFPRSYAAFVLGEDLAGPVEPLDRELTLATRQLDSLLRIAGPPPFALIIEAQSYADEKLEERLRDYCCIQVIRAHRLPVSVAVLFLQRSACPDAARAGNSATWHSAPVGGRSALALEYRPIRLWELDGTAALQTLPPELAPLVPLMDRGGRPAEQVVQACLARALEVPAPGTREDVYTCTAALASLRYDIAVVRRLVEERMIAETPLIQELLREWTEASRREAAERGRAEGHAAGFAEGREEGRAEGRAEGEAEAAIHIAARIARARFGTVPEGLAELLRGLGHDQREASVERLAVAGSLEEWLSSLR
jgi:predicted transposase YdaD